MRMSKSVRAYMPILGRKGGSAKSERKTHASRENGKKGGRPKRNLEKSS